ncbi:hypothetical protein Drorol1_Dr00000063 [Drosera rotundifolia]
MKRYLETSSTHLTTNLPQHALLSQEPKPSNLTSLSRSHHHLHRWVSPSSLSLNQSSRRGNSDESPRSLRVEQGIILGVELDLKVKLVCVFESFVLVGFEAVVRGFIRRFLVVLCAVGVGYSSAAKSRNWWCLVRVRERVRGQKIVRVFIQDELEFKTVTRAMLLVLDYRGDVNDGWSLVVILMMFCGWTPEIKILRFSCDECCWEMSGLSNLVRSG